MCVGHSLLSKMSRAFVVSWWAITKAGTYHQGHVLLETEDGRIPTRSVAMVAVNKRLALLHTYKEIVYGFPVAVDPGDPNLSDWLV